MMGCETVPLSPGKNTSVSDACHWGQKWQPRESTVPEDAHAYCKKGKPKAVPAGDTHLTPITAKERRKLDERIKKKYDRFRRRCPEIHGKVMDFSTTTLPSAGRCGRHFGVGQKIAHRNARIVLSGEVVSHADWIGSVL